MSKQEKQIVMTYKYKMYRNKSLRHLDRLIDYHCEVYNYCIALHRRYYKMYHKHLSANKLKVHLTKVRKSPNKEHWRELGSQSIQDVAERIERSYKAVSSLTPRMNNAAVCTVSRISARERITLLSH